MTDIIAMFDSDAATISWLMSVFTFVGIVIAIPTGVLLRRIGPRNVILLAVVVNVLAAVVGALVDSIGALLVTRALEGVSLVFVVASSPMVIQRCVDPGKIGLSTGIYMLGGMLGATFAGVMTPTLYYGFGYAGLWNGYALLVALCGFGFAVYIKSHHVEVRQGERASDVIRTSHRGDYGVFFEVKYAEISYSIRDISDGIADDSSYSPTALQQRGLSPAISGFVSTLPMLLAVVSSVAFGVISDRTGRCKFLCVIGLATLGPCCFLMLNSSGLAMWFSLIAMGLFSMGAPTVFVAAYPKILVNPK